ncbi:LysR family transcriptional regulator [Kitasatospora sp. GAS204B]|uniref:LysR family transcriptional regulator n=1 Tax=unclassified Kitasatospora TaxID=2633591 RepID=UPI0024737332|nr:LysR family transcriptional regulator [Kitasatospora sp. GAS204B]MDH6120993.1 DNA-binding transcriptional LysR family regulator [Kitasatospora sp. GAS204B]
MTLTQLRAFLAVARLGSVKAAAISLRVSEPAVSGAIAALRREFGDRLFVRAGGGIALTPGGRRLAAGAAEIVGLAEETRRQVRAAGTEGGYLRLATTEQLAEQIAPPLLEAFVRRHPDVETTTLTVPSSALAELLLDRRADVVVGLAGADQSGSAGPPGPDTFEHIPFLRFQLVVVAARNCAGSGLDRLAGGRLHLPVGRLPKAHWLLGPGGLDPGTPGGAFLTRHGVGEADASVFPSTSAALGAAVAGGGLSVALLHLVRDELRHGSLTVVAVPGTPINGVLRASALPGERRSPTASALCRFVTTPIAVQSLLARDTGVPVGHYRPTVRVSLWS